MFGDRDFEMSAFPLWVHLLVMRDKGLQALDSVVALSFPLCGDSDWDWSLQSASRFLQAQAMEFSHHMGDLGLTDVVAHAWPHASFLVLGTPRAEEERHFVVQIVAQSDIDPCYMYVHEDDLSSEGALCLAQQQWRLVRGIVEERLSLVRERVD